VSAITHAQNTTVAAQQSHASGNGLAGTREPEQTATTASPALVPPPPSRPVGRYTWLDALTSELAPAEVTANVGHVAQTLAGHMNRWGASCYPSLERLAQEARRKKSTVSKHLQLLERLGWLRREVGGGRGRPTRYYAMLPADVILALRPPSAAGPARPPAAAAAPASSDKQCPQETPSPSPLPANLPPCPPVAAAQNEPPGKDAAAHGDQRRPRRQAPPQPRRPAGTDEVLDRLVSGDPQLHHTLDRPWVRRALANALASTGATPHQLLAALDHRAGQLGPLTAAKLPGRALVRRRLPDAVRDLLARQQEAKAHAAHQQAASATVRAEAAARAARAAEEAADNLAVEAVPQALRAEILATIDWLSPHATVDWRTARGARSRLLLACRLANARRPGPDWPAALPEVLATPGWTLEELPPEPPVPPLAMAAGL
jgi:Helix-turn-helix domain